MPSLPDTAVIILLGLLLFGPKGLAQIARQLGKLMGEFRRASNEFRMQMEEELRVAEQEDRQKEIAAIQAAAPVAPMLSTSASDQSADHLQAASHSSSSPSEFDAAVDPLPIATSGELSIMPPSTGLPTPRFSLTPLIESVPKIDPPGADAVTDDTERNQHHPDQRPMRYTNHSIDSPAQNISVPEESLHG